MELSFKPSTIVRALSLAANAAGRNSSGLLGAIQLQATDQALRFSGSDMECQLTGFVPVTADVQVTKTGLVTVPGRKFLDVVKSLPETAVARLVKTDTNLLLTCSGTRCKLSLLNNEAFVDIESTKPSLEIELDNELLLASLKATAFAMASQDVRFFLNGMLLTIEQGCFRTVATDGHRLSVFDQALPGNNQLQVILPRKAVMTLLDMLPGEASPVKIALSEQHARFTLGGFEFLTKLINGQFPDYKSVMPERSHTHLLHVPREGLKEALTRASVLAADRAAGVQMRLSQDTLVVAAQNKESDQFEEQLTVKYGGPEFNIALNIAYLLDFINLYKCEILNFALQGPDKSIQITADNEAGAYVVMPMRL